MPVERIQNHFRDPPPLLRSQTKSVASRRLDLMVQHVPAAVDRLSADRRVESAARGVDNDVEWHLDSQTVAGVTGQYNNTVANVSGFCVFRPAKLRFS